MLHDLDGEIDLILDSGQTNVGLESTVVDLTVDPPRILRPGPITAANLEDVLGIPRVHEAEWLATESGPLLSPGQMATHYAPRTPAVRVDEPGALVRVPWTDRSALIVFGTPILPPLPAALTHRFLLTTPEIAAQGLYVVLHQCDALGADLIVVVPPLDLPEWRAVRDRLWLERLASSKCSAALWIQFFGRSRRGKPRPMGIQSRPGPSAEAFEAGNS